MPHLPRPLPYVALEALGDTPHVVVDGAAREHTRLCLSHWPVSPTPMQLWKDLSAEIAFEYLRAPEFWELGAVAVTTDHLDEDGAVSLFMLTNPEQAFPRSRQLIEIARVGDFGVVTNEEAARACFAIRSLSNFDRSPIASDLAASQRVSHEWTEVCLSRLLTIVTDIVDHPDRFKALYEDEFADYETSNHAIARGDVVIDELPSESLAVVRVLQPPKNVRATVGHDVEINVHPAALHSSTTMCRILLCSERNYVYYDRYETWVRYVSRDLPKRHDLTELAKRLSVEESGSSAWVADSPGSLQPTLRLLGDPESSLSSERLVKVMRDFFSSTAVAWDPFSPTSALQPAHLLSGLADPKEETIDRVRTLWRGRRRAGPSA